MMASSWPGSFLSTFPYTFCRNAGLSLIYFTQCSNTIGRNSERLQYMPYICDTGVELEVLSHVAKVLVQFHLFPLTYMV
jgi:hypothetical protein